MRNLTTAASIWFAGAIGMAIGFGYHQIAIIAAIASVFIPRIPHVRPERSVAASAVLTPEQKQQQDKVNNETPIGAPTSED